MSLQSKCCLVIDHGIFTPFAQRLAREDGFGRVLYWTAWEEGFSRLSDNMIGDGLEDIERIESFWPLIDDGTIDMVAFPDVQNGDLQLHIESLGIPVFGSRNGDRIEWDRELFKRIQKDKKLPQPVYRTIVGLDNLHAFLKDNEDCYIKWSKYRGDCETRRHINYALSEQWLDSMAFRFSPFKSQVRFVVENALDSDVELGIDTYCVDGTLPGEVVNGLEVKDAGYFGVVTPYDEMPKELTDVMEQFLPILKDKRYRNMISSEVRIKGDTAYFTDATQRHASPAGECQLELINNFPEIVWAAANGEMVQPDFKAKYAVQAIITHKDDEDWWRAIEVPEEVQQWVKLYRVCGSGDVFQIVPVSPHFAEVGSVVGIGDTVEKAIKELKDHVEAIKDNPISVDTDSIYHALKEARSANKKGISIDDSIPKPEIALA